MFVFFFSDALSYIALCVIYSEWRHINPHFDSLGFAISTKGEPNTIECLTNFVYETSRLHTTVT